MNFITEKQHTVMIVTETFYGEACFRNHKTVGDKKKNSVCQSLHCCKDCAAEFSPKKQHKCGYSKCVTCKKYLPIDHECFIQPHKFLDEIAYENAGQEEELIVKQILIIYNGYKKVVTLFRTLKHLLSINKEVRGD